MSKQSVNELYLAVLKKKQSSVDDDIDSLSPCAMHSKHYRVTSSTSVA